MTAWATKQNCGGLTGLSEREHPPYAPFWRPFLNCRAQVLASAVVKLSVLREVALLARLTATWRVSDTDRAWLTEVEPRSIRARS